MRPILLLFCILALAWPALAPAATVELRPVSGGAVVLVSAAAQAPADERYLRLDSQFRSTYYFALGSLASQDGHYPEAATLFSRACEADPGSALLWREQGAAWEAAGKEALAATAYGKALDLTPQDLELRQLLARLHLRAGRKELAQSLFKDADGADPVDQAWLRALIGIDVATDSLADAERRLRALLLKAGDQSALDERELLALTLQRQERWSEAAAEFRVLLRADPARSSAWARLAACVDAQGDSLGAIRVLEEGLKADPESLLLMDQQAKAYYRLDRFAEAEAAFDRLLKADPKDTQSLLYRGLARLKQKRFSEAQEDFSALGALEKDSPSQLYGLGLSYLWQGKDAEAEKAFQKVLALNPQAVPAYTQLAFLYDKQGRTAKAVELLKRARKAAPRSMELALLLGAAHMDAKDYPAAEAVYKDALQQAEGKAVLRFQLAVLYDKWDQFPKAEEVLKALLLDEPKNAQALNYLGYSWVERGGDLKEAEALIRRALEADPGNAFYQDSLGWALYKQGRLQEALVELDAAGAKIMKSSREEDPEADEAVVLDHLAELRQALGQAAAAEEAKAAARDLRARAQARSEASPDPAKEPDL